MYSNFPRRFFFLGKSKANLREMKQLGAANETLFYIHYSAYWSNLLQI